MFDEKIFNDESEYLHMVSAANNIPLEELKEKFKFCYEKISKNSSCVNKPQGYIVQRAKHFLDAVLSNSPKRGIPYTHIPFGPHGRAKDWNADEIRSIKAELSRNNWKGPLKEGKLMTMKVNGKDLPVSKIIKYDKVKRYIKEGKIVDEETDESITEWIITEAELWEPGKGDPILRDSRLYKNNKINFMYSAPLRSEYDLKVVGVAWPTVDKMEDAKVKFMEFHLHGEQANPDSEEFYFKNYAPFKAYVDDFELDEDRSNGYKYVLKSYKLSPVGDKIYNIKDLDYDIENLIEEMIDKFGEQDDIPMFIMSLSDIEKYHNSSVVMDENGKPKKTKSGYDMTKWDKYGLLVTRLNGCSDPTNGKKLAFYFTDSSIGNKSVRAFAGQYTFKLPEKIPGTCIVKITTSRGINRYDRDLKKAVPDPENADIFVTADSIADFISFEEVANIK